MYTLAICMNWEDGRPVEICERINLIAEARGKRPQNSNFITCTIERLIHQGAPIEKEYVPAETGCGHRREALYYRATSSVADWYTEFKNKPKATYKQSISEKPMAEDIPRSTALKALTIPAGENLARLRSRF